ncbi:non-heme iron oxygenase ferredoxin subunit [Microbacterium atlanticum]|uniref:non-heme iron oxygenase ferredoxin subunit n=1 Tax=Microbacterium atlanticum TaxID=2782168 RepID=UPI0018878626|nr:non-heme iron oxygenase ferredoxin subunit [Microbacterium atlanticum]
MTSIDTDETGLGPGWVRACPTSDIDIDTAFIVDVKPPVAVYHIEDGFYATDDTCSHAESSLADGYIEEGWVECELHYAKFNIKTGAVMAPPANRPIGTYPVQIVDDIVYVDLSEHRGCAIAALRP